MKITLQDIIDQVAEQAGITKKLSEDFLRELLNVVEEAFDKDGIAKIKGLGTFKLLTVEERKSVNIQTGEEITIPQHNKVSFTPEKELNKAINKPYSHLETYVLSKGGPVDIPENEDEEEEESSEEEEKTIVLEENIAIKENIAIEEDVTVKEDKIKIDSTVENNTKTNNTDMEKRRSNKWIVIIVLLIISGFALLLWYPMLTEDAKIEVAKILPEEKIDEDEIMVGDQSMDETIVEGTSENKQNLDVKTEAKAEPKAEAKAEPKAEAKTEVKAEPKAEPRTGVSSTSPTPNRAPEFQGEYMFDKKFDFRLVDFMQANFPDMKLVTYGTPQEVEVKDGSRLTLIAKKYYGNKRFWVYIYLYNTDIIQHPNDIPAGTVVKVPKLDKSLADPNNPAHIDAAWDVQKYLLKM